MPYEQRIKALEDNLKVLDDGFHMLDERTRIGDHNLDELTNRVDAISQSLARMETRIEDFLTFWGNFLKFLRATLIWTLSVSGSIIGGIIVWYITTHLLGH